MFGGSVQPAQAGEVQLACTRGDWDRIGALVTGMTDEACRVLSRGVFMNCSRKRREQ
jgi:hypothetical protein